MNIKQIRYFVAVAEEQHMGRAAARLHLSQPPLTRQIKALEEELGVALFKRTPQGVDLTEAGRSFWKDAGNIQDLIEQATERTRRVGNGQIGRLDVGIFGSAVLTTIPKILFSFTRSYPGVETVLHNAPFPLQVEALLQRRVLIAFDRHIPDNDELSTELVEEDRLIFAINKFHPLSKMRQVSLSDLATERLVWGRKKIIGPKALEPFHDQGISPNIVYESPDMITTISLVGGGLGIALVPVSMSKIRFPNVVFRPLKQKEKLNFDLYCVFRKDEKSPLLREMLNVVRAYRDNKKQDE
ncbi:LysR substrate-binding domain-containing protein [Telmatospirillum sp.]|uniref:LysR substrate-binding domain-containing protein n=1 Tax=Telmatospirillum sp. TaxID=2079197 RepID=UPI00284F3BDE|nr:LysR substrate-binding domain-containing protein [Telmatospirillum sp.]MDR3435306.1 LysR substrate-binding domain-containing protein [Telmatospirillum sp.]